VKGALHRIQRLDRLALQAKLIEIGRLGHEEPVA